VTTVADNLDLQVRRKRLGLKQRDIANVLSVAISGVSDFENGHRDDLPHGKTRRDYEAVLTAAERSAKKQGGAK